MQRGWIAALIITPIVVGGLVAIAVLVPPPKPPTEAEKARAVLEAVYGTSEATKPTPLPLPIQCEFYIQAARECFAMNPVVNAEASKALEDSARSWSEKATDEDAVRALSKGCSNVLDAVPGSVMASNCPAVRWDWRETYVGDTSKLPPDCKRFVRNAVDCYLALGKTEAFQWDMLKAQAQAAANLAEMGRGADAEKSCRDNIAMIRKMLGPICTDVDWSK